MLYGYVDIRSVELASNAPERINDMRVREGERVSKGQLLATLDTRSLSQNVDQRAAQAAAQEQVLARLVAGSRPEEIRTARADAEAARVDADNAERTYERIKALVALRGVFLEGTPFEVLIPQFWPMAAIGVVALATAAWLLRHRRY